MPELTFEVPYKVADNAFKGLQLSNSYGRGGTDVGRTTARKLFNAYARSTPVTYRFVKKVSEYFPRHAGDNLDQSEDSPKGPSNGYIAWLLWGGSEGWKWAKMVVERVEKQKKSNMAERQYGRKR